ncbi:hypothetical protein PPL_04358 [Heterostelium album PN500]|uniref:Uncharacterized protein n=1 Tax=Heterostelium pallidum (strain ATCC 26659 / Pp 5 / PN500) TaxID=670386 RepID=D3B7C1_HETP5|nr:hypothetical protein PPL_04358 [Heterostelium album PN500]EFA82664.1 hypothetical protein PPL_04358 [Heterostelium album PN500]|eukprot:XP_020434781.1 hypothetical protein PPL_04358 [Heterostelium album PN500]
MICIWRNVKLLNRNRGNQGYKWYQVTSIPRTLWSYGYFDQLRVLMNSLDNEFDARLSFQTKICYSRLVFCSIYSGELRISKVVAVRIIIDQCNICRKSPCC